jgi:hypothetical protein
MVFPNSAFLAERNPIDLLHTTGVHPNNRLISHGTSWMGPGMPVHALRPTKQTRRNQVGTSRSLSEESERCFSHGNIVNKWVFMTFTCLVLAYMCRRQERVAYVRTHVLCHI